jgi:hypothetical protein
MAIIDSLKDLYAKNASAINTFVSAVSAISNAASAVHAILSIVDELEGSDPLQPILDILQEYFAQLYAYLDNQFNTQLWMKLAELVGNAESNIAMLPRALSDPTTDPVAYVATCFSPLMTMSDDTIVSPSPFFVSDYTQQTYWTDEGELIQNNDLGFPYDVGYGPQRPASPADGRTVFFYLYALPYYLKAVYMLTAVGCAFFPDFGQKEKESGALKNFATFLNGIHDKIADSITILKPQPPPWVDPPWVFGPKTEFVQGIVSNFSGNRLNMRLILGAVEKFSGYSSISTPTCGISLDPPIGIPVAEASVHLKLQVRVRHEAMKVYAGVGLRDVWSTINNLYRLAGQQLPTNKYSLYSQWSLRELFGICDVKPRRDGLHLSDLARFIRLTPPLDTSQTGPYSLRNLLEPSGP